MGTSCKVAPAGVEDKELLLADVIFKQTGKRHIFPQTNMPGIEGFMDDGLAFSFKEIESSTKVVRRFNQLYSKVKDNQPNIKDVIGTIKINFNKDSKGNFISPYWVTNKLYKNANPLDFKNDGTFKSVRIILNDNSSFLIDLSKIR